MGRFDDMGRELERIERTKLGQVRRADGHGRHGGGPVRRLQERSRPGQHVDLYA